MPSALPTLDTRPPPTDRDGLAAWLTEQEDRLAEAARDVLVNAVRAAASRFLGVQAAGDPQALDGIVSGWSTFLSTDFLPMLETITLAASVGSFNAAPEVPDSLVPNWTNVVNRQAVSWAAQATNRLRNVGDQVWQQVRNVTAEALANGRVGEELTQTIHDLTSWTEERADTVARTETLGAYANGTHAGNDALGPLGPVEHVWNAVGDARTREAHQAANDQVRKWGQPFDVGGESMLHPHASGASAGNVVNCRCVEDVLYPGDRRPDGSVVEGDQAAGVQNRLGMGDDVPPPTITEHGTGHSFAAHIDPATGQFTPERQQLHDQIVRSQLDGLPSQENPEMLFMGGGGGAGKTTTIRTGNIELPRQGVIVNADEMKELIPEAQAMQAADDRRWAQFSHEESSYIAKRVQAGAVERRINVTMDAVGSDPNKIARQIATARGNGYTARSAYVSIDPVDGMRRAAKRAADAAARGEPGRVIDPAVILKAHLDANQAWERVAMMTDSSVLVDNSGSVPVTIARVVGGAIDVADPDAWLTYLARRRDTWLRARPGFGFGDAELSALLSALQSGPVEYRVSQAQMSAIARLTLERVQELSNHAALGTDPGPLTVDERLSFEASKAAVDAFPGVAWSPVDLG